MIINEFYAIRFPTSKGPDMYGLATLIDREYIIEMKNGRALNRQCLKIYHNFNPNGLVTLEELESFYSDEEINKDDSHVVLNKQYLFHKNKKTQFTAMELILLIRKAIANPIDFKNICKKTICITFKTTLGTRRYSNNLRPEHDIPYHWQILKDYDGQTFDEIEFDGHFPYEKQRKEAEKDFFVIKILKPDDNIQYVVKRKGAGFEVSDQICWARQFLSEDETFRYIERYPDAFGVSGYEIIEFKGMSMEDGLDI